nr:MAG: hypothetical protein [Betatorquevirus sp.]
MSKFYTPAKYNRKQKNLQEVNLHVAIHDLNCGCSNPLKHIIYQFLEQEPTINFTKQELQQLQKCHGTGTAGDIDHGDDDTGFGPGDLEQLFAEEKEEDPAG